LAVQAETPAVRVGIEPGDIIVEIDQQPVTTPDEIAAIAERQSTEILLHIVRGDQAVYLVLKAT
jgi:C-terminal processing protease CtpA/Prc